MEKTFGYELIMNLERCDKEVITSREKLKIYVDELCRLIKMEKYGKAMLPYFGEFSEHTKGYSLAQFIETSSITGHFSELWHKAYINIFSCKWFDEKIAQKFTKDFFKARAMQSRFMVR